MIVSVRLLTRQLVIFVTSQLCLQLFFGVVAHAYKIPRPVLLARSHLSANFPLQLVNSDTSSSPEFPLKSNSTIDEKAAGLTVAESEVMDAMKVPNRRPPLVKSSDIYANIYSGIYNQPFEIEEVDEVDEIENTSFYSNIYYSYDDEKDNDDFAEIRSSMTSQISDSNDDSSYDTSMIGLKNARPPLIKTLTASLSTPEEKSISKLETPNLLTTSPDFSSISKEALPESEIGSEVPVTSEVDIDTDIVIESINKRPPLKRTSILRVDGFSIEPFSKEVESPTKRSEMNSIYSNIYNGLYNQPMEEDENENEDGVGSDEIENTSFYSNIYYSYDDDEENEDASIYNDDVNKSNITSKISEDDSFNKIDTINTTNKRPPLLSFPITNKLISEKEDEENFVYESKFDIMMRSYLKNAENKIQNEIQYVENEKDFDFVISDKDDCDDDESNKTKRIIEETKKIEIEIEIEIGFEGSEIKKTENESEHGEINNVKNKNEFQEFSVIATSMFKHVTTNTESDVMLSSDNNDTDDNDNNNNNNNNNQNDQNDVIMDNNYLDIKNIINDITTTSINVEMENNISIRISKKRKNERIEGVDYLELGVPRSHLILVNNSATLKAMVNIMESNLFLDNDNNKNDRNDNNNIINYNNNNNIINNKNYNNDNNKDYNKNDMKSPILSVVGFDCEWKPESYYRYKKKLIESVSELSITENDDNTKDQVRNNDDNNFNNNKNDKDHNNNNNNNNDKDDNNDNSKDNDSDDDNRIFINNNFENNKKDDRNTKMINSPFPEKSNSDLIPDLDSRISQSMIQNYEEKITIAKQEIEMEKKLIENRKIEINQMNENKNPEVINNIEKGGKRKFIKKIFVGVKNYFESNFLFSKKENSDIKNEKNREEEEEVEEGNGTERKDQVKLGSSSDFSDFMNSVDDLEDDDDNNNYDNNNNNNYNNNNNNNYDNDNEIKKTDESTVTTSLKSSLDLGPTKIPEISNAKLLSDEIEKRNADARAAKINMKKLSKNPLRSKKSKKKFINDNDDEDEWDMIPVNYAKSDEKKIRKEIYSKGSREEENNKNEDSENEEEEEEEEEEIIIKDVNGNEKNKNGRKKVEKDADVILFKSDDDVNNGYINSNFNISWGRFDGPKNKKKQIQKPAPSTMASQVLVLQVRREQEIEREIERERERD